MFPTRLFAVEPFSVDRPEAYRFAELCGGLVIVKRGDERGVRAPSLCSLCRPSSFTALPSPAPRHGGRVPTGSKRPVRLAGPNQQVQ